MLLITFKRDLKIISPFPFVNFHDQIPLWITVSQRFSQNFKIKFHIIRLSNGISLKKEIPLQWKLWMLKIFTLFSAKTSDAIYLNSWKCWLRHSWASDKPFQFIRSIPNTQFQDAMQNEYYMEFACISFT